MADRLTQLQDCLDDLLTQMYASLTYIQSRHPYGDISGQPSQAPQSATATATTNGGTERQTQTSQQQDRPATPPPELPNTFNAAMHELAQDLVLKEQQIEYLINSLPGMGNSELDQVKRMGELEIELRGAETERARAEGQREKMVEAIGGVIVNAKRVG